MVYHYTTVESLYGILSSYKASEDKKHFTFWASNALDQNDSQELSLKHKNLQEAILKVEKEKEDNGNVLGIKKLSNVHQWAFLSGKDQDEFEEDINKNVTDSNSTPFTMSFSRQKDNLLMWSIYANKGNGICLVFDKRKLMKVNVDMDHISQDVMYGNDINNYIQYVRLHYDEYLKIFDNGKILLVNQVMRESPVAVKVMLEFISPFIKNEAFRDEKEWRISFFRDKKTKVYTRITSNLNLVHYIKVGVPISALRKIVIGPCANYDVVRNLIIQEAKECGIDKMMSQEFYVKSSVPYRII